MRARAELTRICLYSLTLCCEHTARRSDLEGTYEAMEQIALDRPGFDAEAHKRCAAREEDFERGDGGGQVRPACALARGSCQRASHQPRRRLCKTARHRRGRCLRRGKTSAVSKALEISTLVRGGPKMNTNIATAPSTARIVYGVATPIHHDETRDSQIAARAARSQRVRGDWHERQFIGARVRRARTQ